MGGTRFTFKLNKRKEEATMKKALSVMSLAVGLLALVSFPALTQTFQYGRSACDAGPGSFVTGDTVVINGLNYYAIVGTEGDDVLVGVDDVNFTGDVICAGKVPAAFQSYDGGRPGGGGNELRAGSP